MSTLNSIYKRILTLVFVVFIASCGSQKGSGDSTEISGSTSDKAVNSNSNPDSDAGGVVLEDDTPTNTPDSENPNDDSISMEEATGDKVWMYDDLDETLRAFFTDFEAAVRNHHQDNFMAVMDPEYVEEQHDGFLEGRTDQFIKEFLSGSSEEGGFQSIPLESVDVLKFEKLERKNGMMMVYYELRAGDLTIHSVWQVTQRVENGGVVYSLYGAVG